MNRSLIAALRLVTTAFCLAAAVHSPARAGLVTGNWDPQFGSFLPNLSWQVQGTFQVPNACSAQADGIYSTASGACSGSIIQSVDLKMFNTSNPVDFGTWTLGPSFISSGGLSQVRVQAGTVVGFQTATAFAQSLIYDTSTATYFSIPSAAEGNLYSLQLNSFGPLLKCVKCRATLAEVVAQLGNPPNVPDIASNTVGLNQFLVTYTSTNTATPKFTDANGNALGARLDAQGSLLGFSTSIGGSISVPEPGTLGLAMTALAAIGIFAGIGRPRSPRSPR